MKQYSSKIIAPRPSAVPVLAEAGFYLIKLYTHNHDSLFGDVHNGCLELNGIGQIAADEWLRSAQAYPTLGLDEWIILPNRIEGIVSIREASEPRRYGESAKLKPRLLSSFIASYKAAAAKRINLLTNAPGSTIWQRNYQERFIPDDLSLQRVRQMLQKHPVL